MRYRGLVVDFGGVLTTSVRESFLEFCRKEGIDPERLRDLLRSSYRREEPGALVAMIETGKIPKEEFERRLAAILSDGLEREIDAEDLVVRMAEGITLEPRMVAAVRAAHAAGTRTVLLSNSWGADEYPDELLGELFDDVVISGRVGLRKPDPDVFRLAAERVGLGPEECVFIDDSPVNVEAAEKVGMRGLVHHEPGESIHVLEELLEMGPLEPGPTDSIEEEAPWQKRT